MPELPEVETVARQLAPALQGRRLEKLRVLDAKLGTIGRGLGSSSILEVKRVGKQVVLRLEKGGRPVYLGVHLRMTGRLLVDHDGSTDTRHLRAVFELDHGRLFFRDPRRFGTIVRSMEPIVAPGIDPMKAEFRPDWLREVLSHSRSPLKTWMLRQDRITGIGNIYASEILFASGLHPLREARSLDAEECSRLHRETKRILQAAIRACGTTFSDFQDAQGVEGSYQKYLKVYNRRDENCSHCGGSIERIVQQQRSTWYCPRCQPLPKGTS